MDQLNSVFDTLGMQDMAGRASRAYPALLGHRSTSAAGLSISKGARGHACDHGERGAHVRSVWWRGACRGACGSGTCSRAAMAVLEILRATAIWPLHACWPPPMHELAVLAMAAHPDGMACSLLSGVKGGGGGALRCAGRQRTMGVEARSWDLGPLQLSRIRWRREKRSDGGERKNK